MSRTRRGSFFQKFAHKVKQNQQDVTSEGKNDDPPDSQFSKRPVNHPGGLKGKHQRTDLAFG